MHVKMALSWINNKVVPILIDVIYFLQITVWTVGCWKMNF